MFSLQTSRYSLGNLMTEILKMTKNCEIYLNNSTREARGQEFDKFLKIGLVLTRGEGGNAWN